MSRILLISLLLALPNLIIELISMNNFVYFVQQNGLVGLLIFNLPLLLFILNLIIFYLLKNEKTKNTLITIITGFQLIISLIYLIALLTPVY